MDNPADSPTDSISKKLLQTRGLRKGGGRALGSINKKTKLKIESLERAERFLDNKGYTFDKWCLEHQDEVWRAKLFRLNKIACAQATAEIPQEFTGKVLFGWIADDHEDNGPI